MARKAYPSDLSEEEWKMMEVYVPAAKSGGRPAEHSRREIVNAILYVLRTGCGWEYVPHDFPAWQTVYDYFNQWKMAGVWEAANAALTKQSRQRQGREISPSLGIIDSQSAATTEKGGRKVLTLTNTLKAVNDIL